MHVGVLLARVEEAEAAKPRVAERAVQRKTRVKVHKCQLAPGARGHHHVLPDGQRMAGRLGLGRALARAPLRALGA
jgi:hypothetical protein